MLADQCCELFFELFKIRFFVERGGAGFRVKPAVERPQYFARAVRAVEKKEEISPDFATAAVQNESIAAYAAGTLPALRPIVEDAVPAVTVAGKEIVVSNGAELVRPDRSLLVLVDN